MHDNASGTPTATPDLTVLLQRAFAVADANRLFGLVRGYMEHGLTDSELEHAAADPGAWEWMQELRREIPGIALLESRVGEVAVREALQAEAARILARRIREADRPQVPDFWPGERWLAA